MIRRLSVATELIVEWCKASPHGWCLDRQPLPPDARAVGLRREWNGQRWALAILVESEQWPVGAPEVIEPPMFRAIKSDGGECMSANERASI